ncbi:DUF262 domain-containing protein [Mycena chlorophos]|uniref:DUF262 domain-containing protein n=1 Tax=Mycena chlorophos TaxID=658473 RepID=A0A8H6W5K7_MYCCL|nr:DUF262 domain-containing protein [Mycena chlorophos]
MAAHSHSDDGLDGLDDDDDEGDYIDPSLDHPHSAFGGPAAANQAANRAAVAAGSCIRHRFPAHMREGVTTVRLFEWLQSGKIDLEAEYQRDFVWKAPAQESLVDSLLRGAPVNQLMFSACWFLAQYSLLTRDREVLGTWAREAVVCGWKAAVDESVGFHEWQGALCYPAFGVLC